MAGKIDLAKIISGIIKPTMGGNHFNGEDITELNITERARKELAGFQQPVRFKGLTVHDLIDIAAAKKMSVQEAGHYLIKKVGLCAKDYINRELNEGLSGGEIKRIEIK